jgi:EF-hand domain pair
MSANTAPTLSLWLTGSLQSALGLRLTTRESDVSGSEPLQVQGLTNEALVDRISLLFTEADSDGNGSLSRKEFQDIFMLLAEELELTEGDVWHILAEADENDDGVVQYKEFVPVAVDLVMALLAKESYESTKRVRRTSAKEEAKDFLLKGLPKGDLEASIREVTYAPCASSAEMLLSCSSPLIACSLTEIHLDIQSALIVVLRDSLA